MNQEERLLLIDSLLDGSISDADRLRIEAEMIVDRSVRQEYYDRVKLAMLFENELAESPAFSPPISPANTKRTRWITILSGSILAVAASILVLVISGKTTDPSGEGNPASQPTAAGLRSGAELSASGFAVLNGQDDAVWTGTAFREGDLLPSGELHLAAGLAHIELFSGVQIVVEGECQFTIDSPMQVTMLRGMARAHVPEPAQGFRIKTASGDVVDLGTEFSVNVDHDGADVHVIDGKVELHPPGSDLLRLDAGASRRLAESGHILDARSQSTGPVGPTEFQDRVRQKQQRRFSQWSQWGDSVQSDPRVVAHYRFRSDRPQTRLIENLANHRSPLASDGTIVAAKRGTDRWGRSEGAIDFSPIGSRIRVDVPSEHRGVTLICWVKINSLDRWYNSLFLTDGHEEREPHWQLMDDGRVFFSVKVPKDETESQRPQPVFYSPSIWTPALSGRWIMLAVTYDVDREMVTHYLNGQPISSERIPDQMLVESIRIGHASICNWSEPMYRTDPDFVLRNLNGTMDEFAMYSGALSADEIMQWYETGNPNE
ncbi:LamG-like jellyroll fold domain-containing protein [Roseiconus nitratireducens]|nr:LamG-like jellyroll fold domain-containing protein [Roseiconus nitratireducens]